MEEDEDAPNPIPPWVKLEYSHMQILAGSDAQVRFTYLSKSSSESLDATFAVESKNPSLATFSCHQESILDLMKISGISIEKICLLDPKAERELLPEDGDNFEWFLFGGILGDDPPRDRTSTLRVHGFPSRHLGPIQMTTDTAVGVTKLVVADKIPLPNVHYTDYPTIRFNAKESVEMPFRYIVVNGEPLLPPGMKELLKKDLDKGFDF